MTTQTFSSAIDHTSDAGFRAWGNEVKTNLGLVGLTQTADTGQINWVTVTRPGVSTVGGYEVWRFADSSLYMKIEYGTGANVTNPQMWITVGTGSNGSGTLTGQLSTRNTFTTSLSPLSTVTPYASYMCRVADAFSFRWKVGGNSSAFDFGLLCVGKTVDTAGAATTTGYGVLRCAGAAAALTFQSVRTVATAATYTDQAFFSTIAGQPASSVDASGNFQAYEIWLNTPSVTPFNWANVVVLADIPKNFTFSVAMVGATAHTYISAGQANATATIGTYTATYASVGMIYE